ncbi:MAG TPA: efflux RND transporter periplasmic adaptor subunit [Sphingobium sp.]|uniref:efflux RND transporter periplasmic adaptor subunit n=1 Tax=Sphingobium sp. TaxID=1912891 RepID=UPI002ED20349
MTSVRYLPPVLAPMLAVTLLLGGCGAKTEERQQLPPQTVTATTIQLHAMKGLLTASGRLVPREETAVVADVGGYRVAKVFVEEGAFVRQGQVLATLDDSLLVSQIDQLRAALAQQRVAAEQARDQATRVEGIDGQGVISGEAIAGRRFSARSSQAAVAATQAQLKDLLVRQNHLIIRAPSDGLILERTVRPGDTSAVGTAMFRMARGGLIEHYAELSEADVARIHVGDPASVALPSGRNLTGTVRLIGARVDNQTGLVIARIQLPRDPELRQGTFANARFTRTVTTRAVPEAAVRFDADGASVTLIGSDNRVKRIKVHTGLRGGGLVELVDGPPLGARVAVQGSAFTLDGDKVRIAGAAQ